ncbi:uncharacterized protein LOC127712415 [Mytilus californianus]|uniref:uncharacterized protein LOC127712415 n=1 Tax=Mytilus californianus TaxID=6549 RepID=UPI002245EBF0|nr:uncharacterized protein LOC127712415 [Mytilus californianus]
MSYKFLLITYVFLCSCIPGITAGKREFGGDVSQLWNELRELKAVLSETRLDLHNTRTELGVTKDVLGKELEKTKQALVDTRQDLADTRRELDETKKWINVNNGQYNVIHTTNDRKRLIDSTDELHQVQVDLQNLKANLAAVKLQVKTSQIPRIGFTAVLSKDVSNLGDNQVIRFDTVYTNYGSDYNHQTGIFTCAIPGLYAFYVHTLANPGKHLETEITKNLQPMASTYAYDKDFYSSGSNMAVMALQIGDTVLVRSHGSEHDHAGSVIDYMYTSFSGFLIAS